MPSTTTSRARCSQHGTRRARDTASSCSPRSRRSATTSSTRRRFPRRARSSTRSSRRWCSLLPVVQDELVAFGVFTERHVTHRRIGYLTVVVEGHAAALRVLDRLRDVVDREHHAAAVAFFSVLRTVDAEARTVTERPLRQAPLPLRLGCGAEQLGVELLLLRDVGHDVVGGIDSVDFHAGARTRAALALLLRRPDQHLVDRHVARSRPSSEVTTVPRSAKRWRSAWPASNGSIPRTWPTRFSTWSAARATWRSTRC